MSYRKLEVNGQTFEYSVGRSHVKIRYVGAFDKREIGYVLNDWEVRVRPSDIANFIKEKNLQLKT